MNKPKVSKLLDEYAIESGKHWVCSYGGICARGKTPAESFDELRDHFRHLSSPRPVPTLTRMF